MLREAEGDEEIFWDSAHGSDVTEVDDQCLLPQAEGIDPGSIEVDAFNEYIGRGQQNLIAHLDDGDIIPDALKQGRISDRHPFPDSVDKPELPDLPKFHSIL